MNQPVLLQCMPNCFARIVPSGDQKNRIVLIAKTNVSAGEELTYGLLCFFISFDLMCVHIRNHAYWMWHRAYLMNDLFLLGMDILISLTWITVFSSFNVATGIITRSMMSGMKKRLSVAVKPLTVADLWTRFYTVFARGAIAVTQPWGNICRFLYFIFLC